MGVITFLYYVWKWTGNIKNNMYIGRIQIDMLTEIPHKIADFVTINRISKELCFHAISTLISMYLLLFKYQ